MSDRCEDGQIQDLELALENAEARAEKAELECKVLAHGQVTEYRRGYNLGVIVSRARSETAEGKIERVREILMKLERPYTNFESIAEVRSQLRKALEGE
jgi:hypothetical protein